MDVDLDEQSAKKIKLEVADRPLNFAINPDDYDFHSTKKTKTPRDPMSHRIIEKRRRDRMNNCLAELSRLIPSNYLKQGQGRIEKTEIIEMASKHIRHLQNLSNFHGGQMEGFHVDGKGKACCEEKFYMGFKECQDEVMKFLIEVEGRDVKDTMYSGIFCHLEHTSKKFFHNNNEKETNSDEKKQTISSNYVVDDCSLSNDQSIMVPSYQSTGEMTAMTTATCDVQKSSQNQMLNNGNQNNYRRNLLLPKDSGQDDSSVIGTSSLPARPLHGESSDSPRQGLSLLSDTCGQLLNLGCDNMYSSARSGDGNRSVMSDKVSSYGSSMSSDKTLNDSDHNSAYASSGSVNSNGGSSHDSSVYKFKHNITKRFSQEEKLELHPAPSNCETSSSSSREEEKEKVKRKHPRLFPRNKGRGYSFDGGHLSSDTIQSNYKYGHGITNVYSHCIEKSESAGMDLPLPAFVLNPDGTHYIPISIHPSYLETSTSKEMSELQTYHPISIPVNFGGPHVTMRRMVPASTNSLLNTTKE